MNAGNTKQTHWKLIEAREGKPGDQYFHKEWTDVAEGMNLTGLMVRRAMTEAEEHAEELLAGYKAFLEWVIDPDGDPNAWGLMVHAAECDIAKAEGKPAPSTEPKA